MHSHSRARRLAIALGACCLTTARVAAAQAPPLAAAASAAAPDSAHGGTLLTRRDLVAAGALAVATGALLPFDQRLAEEFRDPGPQRSTALRDGAKAFNALGDPGTLVIAAGLFGAGRVTHRPHLADLGLHTTEAILLSGAATAAIKGLAGRQRPFADETAPYAFSLGRGFSGGARASFPSGHATAAFATAAAVTEETRHWWPAAPWVVGPLLYGGAGLVALARMYDDKHWASDVALGAGIGTISGLSVVRYNHRHPRNRVDRRLGVASAVPAVSPAPGGLALVWHVGAP